MTHGYFHEYGDHATGNNWRIFTRRVLSPAEEQEIDRWLTMYLSGAVDYTSYPQVVTMNTAVPGVRQRIGDAERERASTALSDHFVAGRLSQSEFETRVGRVQKAWFQSDLDDVLKDLPADKVTRTPCVPVTAIGGMPSVPRPRHRVMHYVTGGAHIGYGLMLIVLGLLTWVGAISSDFRYAGAFEIASVVGGAFCVWFGAMGIRLADD